VTLARVVLLVAALVASGAGCPWRHRIDQGAAARAALKSVQYVRRSFQSSLAGCNDPTSHAPAPCVRMDVEYVEATRSTIELARAVAAFVGATVLRPVGDGGPVTDVEMLRDLLYDLYRERQQAFPDYRIPWQLERTVSVACNTPRIQGLVAADHSFTGGAAPVERVDYRSLDTTTGARVGLDGLVAPENQDAFTAQLERRFREARRLAFGQGLAAAGFDFSGGRFAATDNLLACPDALTFRWNPGDVAPTVFGPTEVVVPRAEVAELLRSDAPL
jgi:hypothetical protein